jgi:histidinol-phosphate phosphatase family protein
VKRLGVAVIGCGLIGRRRAATAAAHPATELRVVVDRDAARAREAAEGAGTTTGQGGADVATDWEAVLQRDDVDAVVACTPNALLAPIAVAALRSGRHVLVEKPMGRSVLEAEAMAVAAAASGRVLKAGFNHRYHPAIARMHELLVAGEVGAPVQLRARYGHGSRPGCEKEWRGDPELAGGGELLDQGVHVVDLFQWMVGAPVRVQAELQTAVWPLAPLEDNAFGLLRFGGGVVGQFHVSMTQWKNLFSLEIHGQNGALVVDGIGGSYGVERLHVVRRNMAGGVPETEVHEYPGPDASWAAEWDDFVQAMHGGRLRHGTAASGVAVMRTVDAIYRAASSGMAVGVRSPAVFLDRDGVLNEVIVRDGHPASPRCVAELELVADIGVVHELRAAGYRVFIITNQPDVARGLMPAHELEAMMQRIAARIPVDEYAVCPHEDDDACDCRKPLPGMIHGLAERWNVDLSRSWVIGDTWRDIDTARAAGCGSILIRRWYNDGVHADHEVSSLAEAVQLAAGNAVTRAPATDASH